MRWPQTGQHGSVRSQPGQCLAASTLPCPSFHLEVRGQPEFYLPQTQCFNFIRVLVSFNATHLYACGTFAFSPACTFIVSYLPPRSRTKQPCLYLSQLILCALENWTLRILMNSGPLTNDPLCPFFFFLHAPHFPYVRPWCSGPPASFLPLGTPRFLPVAHLRGKGDGGERSEPF